ncbi:MAG: adenosylcobyric acid synthase [Thiomicrorhabdus sp.]|nr:MAG: adenosylcobyric acid synthase [Thiomicrorhabdus sp.]
MKTTQASCLMVQGCTSDAGKSTLVAGLCRLLQRQGHSVAPFKPQNMALNSAVTEDGGEIGRAQALQAMAAKVPLSVHMNPVLLKPNSDTGAQVILQGHSIGNLNAMDYHDYKPKANQAVLDSFKILSSQYQTILVEGAGSPAEVNLRENDIANMGFAEQVDCPVILVADIDKGGVFAHLIGTLACLSESEQNRIKGFVINRFRGDIKLLEDGLTWLEEQTGKPVLGVLPYLHGLHLDAEDAISSSEVDTEKACFKVIVPLLPHMSNHTDFEPLRLHPEIDFQYVKHQEGTHQTIPPADLIILPGSKNVIADLCWLKSQGWQKAIQKHLRYGGKLIGICGGLQMCGAWILDPDQIEGKLAQKAGLGLFSYQTTLKPHKKLTNVTGQLLCQTDSRSKIEVVQVSGYEIHAGETVGQPETAAIKLANGINEGAISDDNQILVSYLHGLFDQPKALNKLLSWAGFKPDTQVDIDQIRETQLERLANTFEENLNMDLLFEILTAQDVAVPKTLEHAFLPHQIESVYQVIEQRRDMRHFLDKPIKPALLDRILAAAHNAPSVGLMQPWRFIRISDQEIRTKLHQEVEKERLRTATALNKCKDEFMKLKVEGILECAEVIVISLSDKRAQEIFGRRTLPEMDIASVGCAIQNLALAARAEGIGMGWVSLFDPKVVAELLQIPTTDNEEDGGKPIAILCLGHVAEFYKIPMLERDNWRKPLPVEQVTFYNRWNKLHSGHQ